MEILSKNCLISKFQNFMCTLYGMSSSCFCAIFMKKCCHGKEAHSYILNCCIDSFAQGQMSFWKRYVAKLIKHKTTKRECVPLQTDWHNMENCKKKKQQVNSNNDNNDSSENSSNRELPMQQQRQQISSRPLIFISICYVFFYSAYAYTNLMSVFLSFFPLFLFLTIFVLLALFRSY